MPCPTSVIFVCLAVWTLARSSACDPPSAHRATPFVKGIPVKCQNACLFFWPLKRIKCTTKHYSTVQYRQIKQVTASLTSPVHGGHNAGIGAVPIVDADERVVGIYSRSDITFLATAADPEGVLQVLILLILIILIILYCTLVVTLH